MFFRMNLQDLDVVHYTALVSVILYYIFSETLQHPLHNTSPLSVSSFLQCPYCLYDCSQFPQSQTVSDNLYSFFNPVLLFQINYQNRLFQKPPACHRGLHCISLYRVFRHIVLLFDMLLAVRFQ